MTLGSRLAVAGLGLAPMFACGSPPPPQPGQREFEATSDRIRSSSAGEAWQGNSDAAVGYAREFAETMAQADPELFTGQDEDQTLTLADEFLVFAHHSEHGVVFLAHVPQLKRYRDDVRERLLQEAWDAAFHATRRIHDDGPINLGVGLRGTVSYGAIATAVSDQRPAMEFDESLEPSSLYPFFAARAVTTEPTEKEAKPFVPPVEPPSTPALTWEVLHATGVPESYATTQLQSSEGDFDRCVAAGVDALEIEQRFDVRLHLDKKGRVNKLAKYAGQEAPDPIHDCLAEASKRWEIPASTLAKKGGIVVITFRWALPESP